MLLFMPQNIQYIEHVVIFSILIHNNHVDSTSNCNFRLGPFIGNRSSLLMFSMVDLLFKS